MVLVYHQGRILLNYKGFCVLEILGRERKIKFKYDVLIHILRNIEILQVQRYTHYENLAGRNQTDLIISILWAIKY